MIVELVGLEVLGRHGVSDYEREHGRIFSYDITLEIAEPPSDEIEATVDYRAVAQCVREVSDAQRFKLIETLASAVADELAARFRPARVQVRVRKPGIAPAGLAVEYAAATAVRES
jgi:7,8-dihydroneopterin aldolase/epimerase/oxygenase